MRNFYSYILIFVIATLFGCASHRGTTIERVRTEYIHQTDTLHHRDSTYVHDSIFVSVLGDTVFLNKYRTEYRDRYIYRNHTDTLLRTDTCLTTTIKVIPAKLSAIQKFRLHTGDAFLIAIVAFIVYLVIKRKLPW